MKLKIFLAMMVIALCAVACSDDDKEEVVIIPAQEIAGVYDGYTKAVAQYFPDGQYAVEQTVKIEANDDETVTVSYTSDSFGTFTIKNATVKLENSVYTVSGSGSTLMGMGDSKKEYECTLTASIDAAKQASSFYFDVPAVMGGMKIEFIQGEAPANVMVADSYSGYTKAVAQYFPDGMYANDQTVKVTANNDGTVNVSYESDSFGSFTINNATVNLENSTYAISGSGSTLMGMDEATQKEYDCTLTATIDAAKKEPSFTFSVPAVMGGLTITFALGDAPEDAQ